MEELVRARVEVKKINFDKEGFVIFTGKILRSDSVIPDDINAKKVTVKGKIASLTLGDELEVEGIWEKKHGYDRALAISKQKKVLPSTVKGIEAFLAKNVRGLGKKKAKLLTDAFGIYTLEMLKDESKAEEVGMVYGIGLNLAKEVQASVISHYAFEEVLLFLMAHQVSHGTIVKAYDVFGRSSIQMIKENPYQLIKECRASFLEADRVAKTFHYTFDNKERIVAAIIQIMNEDTMTNGNLYMEKEELFRRLPNYLKESGVYKEDITLYSVDILQKGYVEALKRELIRLDKTTDKKEVVFLRLNYVMEEQIVFHLNRLLTETLPSFDVTAIRYALESYQKENGMEMDEKQKDAVISALTNGISILTGGPGTGKTMTINAVIYCLEKLKEHANIVLCAPTGKASKRMTELTKKEAKTIHRLLGIGLQKNMQTIEQIDADLLIIDEASMVDIYIAYRLLKTISPTTRVLFVGDYSQLPSVGAGLILRDFINSGCIPTVRLTTIFRQAQESQIVMNSHAVLKKVRKADKVLQFNQKKGDFYFIEEKNSEKVQALMIKSVERFLSSAYDYELKDIQLLTCMHGGACGVIQLNKKMQKQFNPPSSAKAEIELENKTIFREGDKVIHTENNKTLGVFNGETGIIEKIIYNENGDYLLLVEYDDRKVEYTSKFFSQLELAYCLSVHKSQGSEFPVVIMPIDRSQKTMLSQNIVYTGWTRAREALVNIGEENLLYEAIQKETAIHRTSLLLERIQKKLKQPLPV